MSYSMVLELITDDSLLTHLQKSKQNLWWFKDYYSAVMAINTYNLWVWLWDQLQCILNPCDPRADHSLTVFLTWVGDCASPGSVGNVSRSLVQGIWEMWAGQLIQPGPCVPGWGTGRRLYHWWGVLFLSQQTYHLLWRAHKSTRTQPKAYLSLPHARKTYFSKGYL